MSDGGRPVILAPAAQRQLRRLLPGDAARLRGPILALGIDAYPPGSAKLTGTAFSRLRVGALRIVYLVDADQSIVVLRAAWRWERTYRRVDR